MLSRRALLGLAPVAVGLSLGGSPRRAAGQSDAPGELERLHRPQLRVPRTTANGAKVPIVVEVPHPMEPDHYITRVHVVNARDPVPSKGVFHFSPANGQAYVAVQARMDSGASQVVVTAECNRHGRWSASRDILVETGGGGCAGHAPPPERLGPDAITPPALRIPQLLADPVVRRGQILDVQVKIKHPVRTGLEVRDGVFVQATEPFFLTELAVVYAGAPVSRYAMTPALSDNPFITFRLRAGSGGRLEVRLVNNRGQRFAVATDLEVA